MGWKLYFKYLTRKVGGLLLFFSNTSQNLLDLQLPPFYQNMIEAWLCSKEFLLKKEISKRNEILYNNKFIRIEGQTYFSESLFLNNIFKIHHIVNKEGKIKSSHEFQKMGLDQCKIDIIKQIFKNIPTSWKEFLNKNYYPQEDTGLNIQFQINENNYYLCNITSKKIYEALLNIRGEKSHAASNLERIYSLSEKDTQTIFLRPRKSTLNSKLREFQFKMLYNLIYTKKYLYVFKFATSNLCSLCNKEKRRMNIYFLHAK